MTDRPRLLTITAAAAQLEVHPETLRRAIRAGRLACYRMGGCVRLSPDHLTAYLEAALCPARDPKDPDWNGAADPGPSSGGTKASVAAFQRARQMKSALDKPSRTSRPSLHVIPSS